ncbi:hypothetical protein [Paenibacillus odorifer]|uniref:hypothetical protein n=1 Tax=Paenibacillus odorifer TaxID=189426 RepID=UPI00096F49AA|nr:hypothetical protein [Paenibacillus odorifer]OMD78150.1 hypothetical protein BSK50_10315 [Paenibacillus odorifer]
MPPDEQFQHYFSRHRISTGEFYMICSALTYLELAAILKSISSRLKDSHVYSTEMGNCHVASSVNYLSDEPLINLHCCRTILALVCIRIAPAGATENPSAILCDWQRKGV